jgi:hypothetical protein
VEILVSIDEMGLVTENGQERLCLGVGYPMSKTPPLALPSRYLIVTLGGQCLALNAESTCGLLTLAETGNVKSPTVQGLLYRAINLTDRLSLPHDSGGPNARVVLLSEQEVRGCVRVAAVLGLLEVQQSQLVPLPMHFCGPERYWYRGIILFAQSIALVLNTTWVLQE